jgi:hypothetical protein
MGSPFIVIRMITGIIIIILFFNICSSREHFFHNRVVLWG